MSGAGRSKGRVTNSVDHNSSFATPGVIGNGQYYGLDRPITDSDISFISGCRNVTRHWGLMGWLMLKDCGHPHIEDIRNIVMKDFLKEPDCVKIVYLLQQWIKLSKKEATAANLLDICCHSAIGGDRRRTKESLTHALPLYTSKGTKFFLYLLHIYTIASVSFLLM